VTVNQNYGKFFNISLANILHGPSVVGLLSLYLDRNRRKLGQGRLGANRQRWGNTGKLDEHVQKGSYQIQCKIRRCSFYNSDQIIAPCPPMGTITNRMLHSVAANIECHIEGGEQ
jgi:hypothetical protein